MSLVLQLMNWFGGILFHCGIVLGKKDSWWDRVVQAMGRKEWSWV